MFDILFKYSPVVYEQGQWIWHSRPASLALFALTSLIVFTLLLAYRRTTTTLQRSWHVALIVIRGACLAILAFCLLEPALSVSTIVTQKSSVLVLVDDSESMSIPDAPGGQRRMQQVAAWLDGDAQRDGVLHRLEENFRVATFRFDARVQPLSGTEALKAGGKSTNIAQALSFAAQQAQQRALSGVILVTDGAASAGADPLHAVRDLIAGNVPVFTVGVGTKIAHDVQIAKVSATPAVLENDMVEVNALLQARGYVDQKAEIELRESGTVLQRQSVTLDEASKRVSMSFAPRAGFAQYTLAVQPLPREVVASNNQKSFLVNSRKRTARILYVEEISPWEFKFIQRALEGDPAVQLTALLKTGQEKFLRLGLRDANELAQGFPKSAAELFGYQAVILRNVPADFFSAEQLQLLHDFVDKRGGGFMMLGGMKSFSEGRYNNTPVAELLPLELLPLFAADGRAIPPQFHEEFRFTPMAEYLNTPLLQLDPEPLANLKMWEALPLLQGYNPLGGAKPGATILAVHPLHRAESPRIVLATQRFGRGRVAALATGTTWRWQMHREHTDMTHERFWRQLARWLSVTAPEAVAVELERESFSPHESVAIHIEVRDSVFAPQLQANVTVKITGPRQQATSLQAATDLTGEQIGEAAKYLANFETATEGLYHVEILAHDRQGRYLGNAESAFFVEPSQAELANPDVQSPLLQRLAEMTKGRYFPIAQAQDLPDALKIAESSYSKMAEHDVWDAPVFFLAMVLLLAAEWYIRRARGLS